MDEHSSATTRDLKRERRRAIRHHCSVRARMVIQVAAAGENANNNVELVDVKAKLLDVTPESATIVTKYDFERGQQLQLILSLPGEEAIDADASVHWSKPLSKKGLYASGARFFSVAPDEKNAIERFLDRLERELAQAEE